MQTKFNPDVGIIIECLEQNIHQTELNINSIHNLMMQTKEWDRHYVDIIIPNGIRDVINAFDEALNRKADAIIQSSIQNYTSVRSKVAAAVMTKINLYHDNVNRKELLCKMVKLLHKPQYLCLKGSNAYKTADMIWYAIGDKSTDFNYYTKRIILTPIYAGALSISAKDDSHHLIKTEYFVQKQINKTRHIHNIKQKVKSFFT